MIDYISLLFMWTIVIGTCIHLYTSAVKESEKTSEEFRRLIARKEAELADEIMKIKREESVK